MRIELAGTTARIAGADTPLAAALRTALADCGSRLVETELPDLLVLSLPLLPAPFDWGTEATLAREAGAAMKTRGSGRIVFLLSAAAALPLRLHPEFSMEMASALALMRSLAMALGPEVAVNALGAGAIATDELVSGEAAMVGHASVGRPGRLDEARDAALFLCDPAAGYLTGQMLSVDGGWMAGYGRSF